MAYLRFAFPHRHLPHLPELHFQHPVQTLHERLMHRIRDDVVILGGVDAVVVEFAASVAPFDQSPALRADGAAVKRSSNSTMPPLGGEADHFTNFTSTFGNSAFTLACVSSG